MLNLTKRFWLTLFVLVSSALIARADLGFWSANLVGKWRHPKSGDTYEFKSNAIFVYRGKGGERTGYWKIVQPTQKESGGSMEGPVALRLQTRQIKAAENRRISRGNWFSRLVVDIVRSPEGDGQFDRNRYYIGDAQWKRVK